jgi:hypothetical protein
MGFMGELPQADLNEFPRKLEEPADSDNINVVIAKRDSIEPQTKKGRPRWRPLFDQLYNLHNGLAVVIRFFYFSI